MNKKFSTLVASALLATAFTASAQSHLDGVTAGQEKIVSGNYYMLSDATTSTKVLAVDGDSLILVDNTLAANVTNAVNLFPKTIYHPQFATAEARNYGLWKVEYKLNIAGTYDYTFTNKATGLQLKWNKSGKAMASGTDLSAFAWGGTYPVPGAVIQAGASTTADYALNMVYVVGEDIEYTASTVVNALIAKSYPQLQVVKVNKTAAIPAEIASAQATYTGGEKTLTILSVTPTATAAIGTVYPTVITASNKSIEAVGTLVNALVASKSTWTASSSEMPKLAADINAIATVLMGEAGISADPDAKAAFTELKAKSDAGLAIGTDANAATKPAGFDAAVDNLVAAWKTCKALSEKGALYDGMTAANFTYPDAAQINIDGLTADASGKYTLPSVIYAVDGNVQLLLGSGTKIAKGTTVIVGNSSTSKFAFKPSLIDEQSMVVGTEGLTSGRVSVKEDTKEILAKNFAFEFAKAGVAEKDASVTFQFPGQDMDNNILAETEFQVVKRNLLIGSNGVGVAGTTGANTKTNYTAVTLLKVKGEELFLVQDTVTYRSDDKKSYYFKYTLKGLDDLTSSVASKDHADSKYYSGVESYHPAAYVFDVKYNVQQDSVVIAPKYIVTKGASKYFGTDSVGVYVGNGGDIFAETASGKVNIVDNQSKYVLSSVNFSGAREMTLINTASTDKKYIISTDRTFTPGIAWETTTLSSGAYLINLVSDLDSRSDDNGKYKVAGILSKNGVESLKAAEAQKFINMPAAQWIVEQNASSKWVKIYNRETGKALAGFDNVQLYKAGAADQVSLFGGDTLKITPITGNAVTDSTWGYFADKAETLKYKKFNLNYYNELNDTKLVDMAADSTLFVNAEEGSVYFSVLPAGIAELHKDVKVGTTTVVKGLKRTAYKLYLTGLNIKGDTTFVVKNAKGDGYRLMKTKSTADNVASFYVAEYNNKVAETKTSATPKVFFAFVEKAGDFKMGVRDGGTLALTREGMSEVRTSAFALVDDAAPVYRRLGVTKADDGFTDLKTDTAKIYLARNDQRFLCENRSNFIAGDSTGVNYLGEFNSKQYPAFSAAMFIDTAYVRANTNRPQYMLALRPQFGKWIPCPEDETHADKYEYQVKADYLVNLTDSLYGQKNQDKLFKFEEKTRLAFVPAIHHGDSLIIVNSKFTGNKKQIKKGEATTFAAADTIDLSKNAWNHVTFQFRLVDDGADANFYIESCNEEGLFSFVQILNGVPVLTKDIEDAERFNISAPTKDVPTDNEDIKAETVKVVAGEGFVTVYGAQGKKIVVSDVLGKTTIVIATSDSETISATQGLAIIAVEGEAAVKAMVK